MKDLTASEMLLNSRKIEGLILLKRPIPSVIERFSRSFNGTRLTIMAASPRMRPLGTSVQRLRLFKPRTRQFGLPPSSSLT